MRIDIWTHLLSPAYLSHLKSQAAGGRGPFFLAQRALHDVDFRLRLADDLDDYRQILTPLPALLASASSWTPSAPSSRTQRIAS